MTQNGEELATVSASSSLWQRWDARRIVTRWSYLELVMIALGSFVAIWKLIHLISHMV